MNSEKAHRGFLIGDVLLIPPRFGACDEATESGNAVIYPEELLTLLHKVLKFQLQFLDELFALLLIQHATMVQNQESVVNRHWHDFDYSLLVRFLFHRAFAAALALFFRAPADIVARLRLPPILPPFRPISAMMRDRVSLSVGGGSSVDRDTTAAAI